MTSFTSSAVETISERNMRMIREYFQENPPTNPAGSASTTDATQRRIYVDGLSPDVNSQMLIAFFERHGEIEKCSVIEDPSTKKSRGYGFIIFKTMELAAKEAIDDPQKKLEGRNVRVRFAYPDEGIPLPPVQHCHTQSGVHRGRK